MKKKLTNPFMLAVQGFVAGAIIFWSTQPGQAEAGPASASAPAISAPQIVGS